MAFGLVLVAYVLARALSGDNDFDGFHRAAQHVLDTGTLSRVKDVQRYPPSFQLLMLPFGLLPLKVAAGLWLVLSVVALWKLPRLLERLMGVPVSAQLVAGCVMLPLVVDNLNLGQSAPVLVCLCALALVWAREGRGLASGFLLGVLALFKVLPVVMLAIPILLCVRGGSGEAGDEAARGTQAALRLVAGALLALLLATAGLVAVVGWEDTRDTTQQWVTKTRAEQTPWALVANNRSLRHNNEGLGVVLARTYCDISPAQAKGSVSLAKWPLSVAWGMYGALLAGLVVAVWRGLFAVRRLMASSEAAARHSAWGGLFALACLGTLLISPIVWTHYFLWVLPAAVFLHERQRLVLWGGVAFAVCFAVTPLRGLGVHIYATYALFWVLALEIVRRARASG